MSGNALDDRKAIAQLAAHLPKIHTLKTLALNDCALSDRVMHQLVYGLYSGFGIDTSVKRKFELRSLQLAKNSLREETNELISFVSLVNTLRVLDLSHTGKYYYNYSPPPPDEAH